MKKFNLSLVLIFLLSAFSFSIKAQNEPAVVIKDKVNETYFKDRVEFHATFTGFASENDVKKICKNMSSQSGVTKCEITGKDGKGNYDFVITVDTPKESSFYKNMLLKNNVNYVEFNRERKSLIDLK